MSDRQRVTFLRRMLLPAAIAMAINPALAPLVVAAPAGGSVVGGSGAISVSGNTTTIDQFSNRLALDWQSFDINSNELVRFNQPSANALALNRVLNNNPTRIMGQLEANGRIILVNPAGIFFTDYSSVNVNALIASGLAINPDDFMNGNLLFGSVGGADGVVVNRGLINATTSVSLLGNAVANDGPAAMIQAELVSINAASEALLTFDAAGHIGVKVNKAVLQNTQGLESAVSNTGEIVAGSVLVEADVAAGLFERAVNNEGIIRAAGIDVSGGEIRLSGRGGDTFHSGVLDVSSQTAAGGLVIVEGENVALVDQASIDASGAAGGGEVLIGGDYKGLNDQIKNARQAFVGEDVVIDAAATGHGDGGRVIVWSDSYTRFGGAISVAANRGNGGFIETSGAQGLFVADSARIDISSLLGQGGHWLIDPDNISIQTAGPDANITGSPNFTDDIPGDGSEPVLTWATIESVLDDGDVTVTTSETGAGDGVITINDSYTFLANTSGNTLSLISATDIVIADGVKLDGGGVDVSLDFTAANDLTVGNGDTGVAIDNIAGSVSLTATAGLLTVNGEINVVGIDGLDADPGNPGVDAMAITLVGGTGVDINAAISSTGGVGGAGNTGNNLGGNGGNGGVITLTATTNNIDIDAAITSTGGAGGTGSGSAADGDGGDGGAIQLTANGGAINVGANLTSQGGLGDTAGVGAALTTSSIDFVHTLGR
ncbi:filamentous hemagglutinin N-terminal domain-containing protein [Oceanicoccus sp. KOV_DT_Chl]|uniref:two-partner secretion domain-containing protein n=1 Tax=Oceanicoccus sp. KOV_DT_Chl TaxID=1904639 RepID=UPI0013580B87|nr:filamentous hemagglutinin N-terminal domain-containing protein [Oceanicoccus sp. KOV_DT_Chl]